MTAVHEEAARRAVAVLAQDPRVEGVAAAGSWGALDEFSDLDLVIAVAPAHEDEVRRERFAIAASIGPLISAFTGEHVGEPRLLVCLYGPPLLHVDLKFAATPDVARRVDEPVILWQRDGALDRALAGSTGAYPPLDRQWCEDRIWTWVHYIAGKIGRGELFEAIDTLGFVRARVLGPLLLVRAGHPPVGVRRVEDRSPDDVAALRATVASHDRASCAAALHATVALYRSLRDEWTRPAIERRDEAERVAMEYAHAIAPAGA